MDRPMMEASESPQSPEATPESARRCGGKTVFKIVAGLVVALALVVGAGYFFGVTLGGRGAVLAAAGANGTDEQRQAADTMVKSLSAQMALYGLQHLDTLPDFVKYPN